MSDDKLERILSKLESIEGRLKILEQKADTIGDSCTNMDRHISFIDKIYMKLRSPIDWISDRFSTHSSRLPNAPTYHICDQDL